MRSSRFLRHNFTHNSFSAVQVNSVGENLLHTSVKAIDLESVLFLLGLQVNFIWLVSYHTWIIFEILRGGQRVLYFA